MELGRFYVEVVDSRIADIVSYISKDEVIAIRQVCERYGEEEEDVRYYNVNSMETSSGHKILKKSDEREAFNYETYLRDKNFAVPTFYGKYVDGEDI